MRIEIQVAPTDVVIPGPQPITAPGPRALWQPSGFYNFARTEAAEWGAECKSILRLVKLGIHLVDAALQVPVVSQIEPCDARPCAAWEGYPVLRDIRGQGCAECNVLKKAAEGHEIERSGYASKLEYDAIAE